MSNRKYEDVKGYWLYSIKVPSVNKYYIGVSKQKCCDRWRKSLYKGKSLQPYLDEWDSMIKTVLIDGLTKEQAYQYEDNIIRALSMNDLCINKQRSGLITNDMNVYNKQRYENNKELQQQYNKQWKENNKEKVKQYHREYMKQWQRQCRLKKKLQIQ